MKDLLEALSPAVTADYSVGTVTAISTADGTVTLNWRGGVADKIPYLLSYTPTVADKVQLLTSESIGILVLGKTLKTATPVAPTVRTVLLNPIRSMTWSENRITGGDGTATNGKVTQGYTIESVFLGAYVYLGSGVVLTSTEIIVKAELLIARVDTAEEPLVTSPRLHELQTFDGAGKPVVLHPERDFLGSDMRPGDVSWTPIPVMWATNIVAVDSIGLVFQANAGMTYAEYADRLNLVAAPSGGGTLRLTIEQG